MQSWIVSHVHLHPYPFLLIQHYLNKKKNVETETIRHSDEASVEVVSQILIKFLLSKNKNLKVSNDKIN